VPKKNNWALVSSRDHSPSQVEEHCDGEMESKIGVIKRMWESKQPDDYPREEYSIVNGEGDQIYIGRYTEGIVVRLNDSPQQVTFLTTAMVDELLKKLMKPQ